MVVARNKRMESWISGVNNELTKTRQKLQRTEKALEVAMDALVYCRECCLVNDEPEKQILLVQAEAQKQINEILEWGIE